MYAYKYKVHIAKGILKLSVTELDLQKSVLCKKTFDVKFNQKTVERPLRRRVKKGEKMKKRKGGNTLLFETSNKQTQVRH